MTAAKPPAPVAPDAESQPQADAELNFAKRILDIPSPYAGDEVIWALRSHRLAREVVRLTAIEHDWQQRYTAINEEYTLCRKLLMERVGELQVAEEALSILKSKAGETRTAGRCCLHPACRYDGHVSYKDFTEWADHCCSVQGCPIRSVKAAPAPAAKEPLVMDQDWRLWKDDKARKCVWDARTGRSCEWPRCCCERVASRHAESPAAKEPTAADKIKLMCPKCKNTPSRPGEKLIHIINCPDREP